jgi:DedD protein
MDRRVKERLIGALILVILAVAFVPELLSGQGRAIPPVPPGSAPTRSYTVQLQTAPVLPSPTPAPPVTAPVIAPLPASAPLPAAAQPAIAPPALESSLPTPQVKQPAVVARTAAQGAWSVQLGSFSSDVNAQNLARELRSKGHHVAVVSSGQGAQARHKVRVGPYADRAAAEGAASQFKSQGQAASVVAP